LSINYDYWKKIYKTQWKAGTGRVNYVHDLLEKKFPKLSVEVTGYCAKEEVYVPPAPHERGEPDLTLFFRNKIIGYIEASGSDIEMKSDDEIWIRPDKFKHAQEIKEKTWFYMVYKNGDFILDVETITPFKDNIRIRYPKGVPEDYIHIPSTKAQPRDKLFKWLREIIS